MIGILFATIHAVAFAAAVCGVAWLTVFMVEKAEQWLDKWSEKCDSDTTSTTEK